jgi:hypothetical protein
MPRGTSRESCGEITHGFFTMTMHRHIFMLQMSQFLAGKGIFAVDYLLYSPDLAPADFWLFPKLESVLKGKHFSDIEDIKSSVKKKLTEIPVQYFKNCFEQ